MNVSDVAYKIDELTGSWNPSGAATSQDLREARLHLADGLLSDTAPQAGQSPLGFRSRRAATGSSFSVSFVIHEPRPSAVARIVV